MERNNETDHRGESISGDVEVIRVLATKASVRRNSKRRTEQSDVTIVSVITIRGFLASATVVLACAARAAANQALIYGILAILAVLVVWWFCAGRRTDG